MANAKYLLIGSTEACSGKSGTILGIANQLFTFKGKLIAYCKPIGTCFDDDQASQEQDIQCMVESLQLPSQRVRSPLLSLDPSTLEKRLTHEDTTDYSQLLQTYLDPIEGDVVFIEGANNLAEGTLFGLSLPQIAQILDIPVLMVARYTSVAIVEPLIKAKQELGDRLIGVVINDIPLDNHTALESLLKPALENHGIPLLGLIPESSLLRSVSVREIAHKLDAEVLCRPDRLDLMVQSLTIGAMNVNSALEYFRQGQNKAVVTGGDRTDLQLAALETSTSCLILTGHMPPQSLIISRAEDLEIPILSVDYDTLKTVEIVDQAFGKVHLHEQIKVTCIQELIEKYFDLETFCQKIGI